LEENNVKQNNNSAQSQNKPVEKKSGDENKNQNRNRSGNYHKKRYYGNRNYHKSDKNKGEKKEDIRQPSRIKKFGFRKVSIVVPLLNEEESIKPLYSQIKTAVDSISSDYEIIFVDDGSSDDSLKKIKELASRDRKVRYISFRKNYGKSPALNAGFDKASGDAVITMDADLQDDPAEIPNLLTKLSEGYDLVSGWKRKRHDPFVKRFSSKFFNYMTRIMSGIKIHDFNCGLKAYRSAVVKTVDVHGELHRYIPVLAGWNGFKVAEVVVKHHPRRYGKTKFGISRFFKGFVDLLTVIFTTRYIKRPMHFFGFFGFLSFMLGFLVNGYLSYEKIFHGRAIGNRPLLFLGMLLIIVGAQFFSVGFLGEIIVHYTRDKKAYSIKEKNI